MAVNIINANSLLPAKRPPSVSESGAVKGPQLQPVESAGGVQKQEPPARTQRAEGYPKSAESLKDLVREANQMLQVARRKLQFSVNEDTGKPVVRLFDAETKELIRQFPPDEILALAKSIEEMMPESVNGFIIKDEA
ncbi:MAG: hypothetical protein B0D96_13335 [Candidatus Sedimenticola endophacoides]|nr:MAG: hypothetical protein B0D94_04000 [Candidatus Sedimenticola endophacoides]OQX32632.1 MAG: hypothetical protein B0D96_13335 [Candidatus Sedimenticola endophacoides]